MSAVTGRIIALYVRCLVCIQTLFAIETAREAVFIPQPSEPLTGKVVQLSICIVLAAAGIAVVLLMGRGRWWAVIVAILVEASWTMIAIEKGITNGYRPHQELFYEAAGLSVAAIIGMLLRPFRVHCGLAGREGTGIESA